MRSIWKGSLQFSLVNFPIRVYSGIDKENELKFNQLNKDTLNKVAYVKQDSVTGDTLENSDIVKGYQNGDDYVVVDQKDFDKVRCESTKVLTVQGFVNPSEIDLALYDCLYIVGPDGEPAKKFYNLFAKALEVTGKAAIGKLVIRQREHTMLIVSRGNGVAMYRLKSPTQIRNVNSIIPETSQVDPGELQMAQTLIEQMEVPFTKVDLTDQYKEALLEMIQNKINGEEQEEIAEPQRQAKNGDLLAALKASIDNVKK